MYKPGKSPPCTPVFVQLTGRKSNAQALGAAFASAVWLARPGRVEMGVGILDRSQPEQTGRLLHVVCSEGEMVTRKLLPLLLPCGVPHRDGFPDTSRENQPLPLGCYSYCTYSYYRIFLTLIIPCSVAAPPFSTLSPETVHPQRPRVCLKTSFLSSSLHRTL